MDAELDRHQNVEFLELPSNAVTYRTHLSGLTIFFALSLLAGCGGEDVGESIPVDRLVLSRIGFSQVAEGFLIFRERAELSAFMTAYEYPSQICNSSGVCAPFHTEPPDIDFDKFALVAVSAGPNRACEFIQVSDIRIGAGTATITYEVRRSDIGTGGACDESLRWMTDFVLIPSAITEVHITRQQ